MGYFNLQEGEKIIWEAKPLPNLKWQFLLRNFLIFLLAFSWFAFIFFMSIFSFLFKIYPPASLAPVLAITIVSTMVVSFIPASLTYDKEYYWIINRRSIHKKGFVGYAVYSIPHERVSDVIISRGFWESIFGFASIHVQSLSGQATTGRGYQGSEGRFLAIEKPEELQELIFKLVKENRKEQKLSF